MGSESTWDPGTQTNLFEVKPGDIARTRRRITLWAQQALKPMSVDNYNGNDYDDNPDELARLEPGEVVLVVSVVPTPAGYFSNDAMVIAPKHGKLGWLSARFLSAVASDGC